MLTKSDRERPLPQHNRVSERRIGWDDQPITEGERNGYNTDCSIDPVAYRSGATLVLQQEVGPCAEWTARAHPGCDHRFGAPRPIVSIDPRSMRYGDRSRRWSFCENVREHSSRSSPAAASCSPRSVRTKEE